MRHRRSFGIAALVAGVAVLDPGRVILLAQGIPTSGLQMYAAAMRVRRIIRRGISGWRCGT